MLNAIMLIDEKVPAEQRRDDGAKGESRKKDYERNTGPVEDCKHPVTGWNVGERGKLFRIFALQREGLRAPAVGTSNI